ncbi:hypothetical protein L218DRAFT_968271 [Marasmius fiardii PR-910]|nr:hypothetical protein L218DRAFT_968271 [Marasmius fiardii PR-910]
MPLPLGQYRIRTFPGQNPIGRSPREDKSLRPKAIVEHAKGAVKDAGIWWLREKWSDSNCYVMTNKHQDAYTCHINEEVLAIMDNNGPPPEFWMLLEQPQHGPNVYIIATNNRQAAWVASGSNPSNIYNVEPIVIERVDLSPGSTPRFPPEALFEIIPLERS